MDSIIRKHALKNASSYKGKAVLEKVLPKVIGEKPELKNDMKELIKKTIRIIAEVNKLSVEEQEAELKIIAPEMLKAKKEEQGLPPLPGETKKVIMRLAPFPSGALHIGNLRGVMLNDEYVKKYRGELILFIDDTIGSEEKPIVPEAYKLIEDGLKWLGVKWSKVMHKSDRLSHYYKLGEELISKGFAYVCHCNSETIHDYRQRGIDCVHRNKGVNENINEWKLMLKGNYKPGEACVRIKTDMKYKNPAFRDRVIFRISEKTHPLAGNKYSVWPLLELTWAADDQLIGTTHILRGKELMIESEMQSYIWDLIGYNKRPLMLHHGLLSIEGVKISKSKSRKEVESGSYTGWDDPRTWSIQSLNRRGIQPQAIRDFILDLGLSQGEIKVAVDKLYTINRRIIDPKAERYFFARNPVKLIIENCPSIKASVPLMPGSSKFKDYSIPEGKVELWVSEDDVSLIKKEKKVRLKDLINIELIKAGKELTCKPAKDQKEVYDIKKIHWVKNFLECSLLKPDGKWDYGYCEEYCNSIKEGVIIQFERYGFARLEEKDKKGLRFIYTHA